MKSIIIFLVFGLFICFFSMYNPQKNKIYQNYFADESFQDTFHIFDHDTIHDHFLPLSYYRNVWKFNFDATTSVVKTFEKHFGACSKNKNEFLWKINLEQFSILEAQLKLVISNNELEIMLTKDLYNFLNPDTSYYRPLKNYFYQICEPLFAKKEIPDTLIIFPINVYHLPYFPDTEFVALVNTSGFAAWDESLYKDAHNQMFKQWKFPVMYKNDKPVSYLTKVNPKLFAFQTRDYIPWVYKQNYLDSTVFNKLFPIEVIQYGTNMGDIIDPEIYALKFKNNIFCLYKRDEENCDNWKKIVQANAVFMEDYQTEHGYVDNEYRHNYLTNMSYYDYNHDGYDDLKIMKFAFGVDWNNPIFSIFLYNKDSQMYDPLYGIENVFEVYETNGKFYGSGGRAILPSLLEWNRRKLLYKEIYINPGYFEGNIEQPIYYKDIFLSKGQLQKKEFYILKNNRKTNISEFEYNRLIK